MNFSHLLDLPITNSQSPSKDGGDFVISAITSDSRKVLKDSVFVAIKGTSGDGHSYLQQALANGAGAIVVEDLSKVPRPISAKVLLVDSTRKFLDAAIARFYNNPSLELLSFGVTGTNGKTTTTYLIEHILNQLGSPTAVMGTIDHHFLSESFQTENTTPGPEELHARLRQFVEKGAKSLAMEVSSHALTQNRADSVHFDVVIFTNLTRDHLDYHQDMESYFWSKQLLFDDVLWKSLKADRVSVVNVDDPYGARIRTGPGTRLVTYGRKTSDYQFDVFNASLNGMEYVMRHRGRQFTGNTHLVGTHNLYNIAGALAALSEKGFHIYEAMSALESFYGVPGRLQKVTNAKNRHVFVDYAHTDDALRNVLNALRDVRDTSGSSGKIITVFGCGGDRDKGKRPLMAKVAEELSDFVVVTSDNPRTEDPQKIIDDICTGFSDINKLKKLVDRREAIRYALEQSQEGDIVLIAGKGHEDYQILGTQKMNFRDDLVAAECLK